MTRVTQEAAKTIEVENAARGLWRNRDGAAAVEFAFNLPILRLLFSGIALGRLPRRIQVLLSALMLDQPNNADSLAELAEYLVYADNPDEAATLIRDAKRLNPNFPNWYHRPAGIAEVAEAFG